MKVCKHCRDAMRAEAMGRPPEGGVRRNPTRWFTGNTGYTPESSLLTAESAKTRLGAELGFDTYIQYMLPAEMLYQVMDASKPGASACPFASPGCKAGCLVQTGHGSFGPTTLARARKTWLYMYDREWYIQSLKRAIRSAINKTMRKAPVQCPITGQLRPRIPVFRLNGTSDIMWESKKNGAIMQAFPTVQFYDYTKLPYSARHVAHSLPNYQLTFSYSDNPDAWDQALEYLDRGMNVAAVWRTFGAIKSLMAAGDWGGPAHRWDPKRRFKVIDGDRDDLRFLDPDNRTTGRVGVIVALFAKVSKNPLTMQKQRMDEHGFFIERVPDVAAVEGWWPPVHFKEKRTGKGLETVSEPLWHAIDGDTYYGRVLADQSAQTEEMAKDIWDMRLRGEFGIGFQAKRFTGDGPPEYSAPKPPKGYISPFIGEALPKVAANAPGRSQTAITNEKIAYWNVNEHRSEFDAIAKARTKQLAKDAQQYVALYFKGRSFPKPAERFPAAVAERDVGIGEHYFNEWSENRMPYAEAVREAERRGRLLGKQVAESTMPATYRAKRRKAADPATAIAEIMQALYDDNEGQQVDAGDVRSAMREASGVAPPMPLIQAVARQMGIPLDKKTTLTKGEAKVLAAWKRGAATPEEVIAAGVNLSEKTIAKALRRLEDDGFFEDEMERRAAKARSNPRRYPRW